MVKMTIGSTHLYFQTICMLPLLLLFQFRLSSSSMQPLCRSEESSALLQFKESFLVNKYASPDPLAYPKVASWNLGGVNNDCCSWDGVECDKTGHVIGLDLINSCLYGSINSSNSLFNLRHLQMLNLALNDFNFSKIPSRFGNLSMLTYLNLSYSLFSGQVPSEISMLSKLSSLDLSVGYGLESLLELKILDLKSLVQNMTNLENLHLDSVKISSPIPDMLANISSLISLHLSHCDLYDEFPVAIFHLPKLQFLHMLDNPNLKGQLPDFQWSSHSHLKSLWLRNTSFLGHLPASIGNFHSLEIFDISYCKFSGMIPFSLGNLSKLVVLDLEGNSFIGQVPSSLGNLTQLMYISLGYNNVSVGNLSWLQKLSKLDYLCLQKTNSHGDISSSLAKLPQLTQLNLGANQFTGEIPSFLVNLTQLNFLNLSANQLTGQPPSWLANLTQLSYINLGSNNLQGSIPTSISGLVNLRTLILSSNHLNGTLELEGLFQLVFLDLGFNQFTGEIPSFLANLTQLETLRLGANQLTGQLPFWLMNLTQLRYLHVGINRLQGTIPSSISRLSNIQYLLLGSNNFIGSIELDAFLVLKNLKSLNIGRNTLSLLTKTSTISTFPDFVDLVLNSCNLTEFPDFLKNQNHLRTLDLSFNNIHGQIPKWILNMSTETLAYMDLSYNFLTTFVQPPAVLPWSGLLFLNISSNLLQGSSLPIASSSILFYSVSNNSLTGEIPTWLCEMSSLQVLDLSNNKLGGMIPQCMGNFSDSLSVLNLENNSFSGNIPQTWTRGNKLRMIKLGQNKLYGQIPRSLSKCTMLESLDLGNNQLNDTFPFWLGSLSELKILIVRFNHFHGTLVGMCKSGSVFPKLRIVDLSSNNLTGMLPSDCFLRWNAMKVVDSEKLAYMQADTSVNMGTYLWNDHYDYSMTITNKGVERLYPKVVEIFSVIDLSCNNFEGEIPELIGNLKGLRSLNLSNNALTGHIPSSITNLTKLESLDLSQNLLSGPIPQELKQLTFLSKFNVAHNHLTGRIPQGNQFDTFPNNSYAGNSGLCGNPLTKSCGNSDGSPSAVEQNEDSGFLFDFGWEVVLMGYGCGLVVGLVIGHFVTTRKHGWFVKTFGRTKRRSRR